MANTHHKFEAMMEEACKTYLKTPPGSDARVDALLHISDLTQRLERQIASMGEAEAEEFVVQAAHTEYGHS